MPIPDQAQAGARRLGCTCFALHKLTRTVMRLYDQHLAVTGLKTTQLSLLRSVQHSPLPVTRLAAALGIERTTATRNLKHLIEAGWVALCPGADPRQRIVTITGAGRDKVLEGQRAWRRAQDELERTLGQQAVYALHDDVDLAMARLAPLLERPAAEPPLAAQSEQ